jgi:uncharacterized protein YbgA (DUF1722 family)/uncharacterized protein YbbK (DUF523 family)
MTPSKPCVGIGACLVGHEVRYNGESKRKNQHIEAMSEHMALKPFCPEVAIGMGVPRSTVRLVGDLGRLALMDSDSQTQDFTADMKQYAASVMRNNPDMAGYILVKGSPSCGMERVKRYNTSGNAMASDATGIFAAELMKLNPLMPLEEDGRLHDHGLRENFVTRVYAYQDWKALVADGISHHKMTRFWARYKYLVMSHHMPSYKLLGKMLASAGSTSLSTTAAEFISTFMLALKKPATRKSNTNVLQHIRGYLKRDLDSEDKREMDQVIEQYRTSVVPLVVPMTLLRHHFKRNSHAYIEQQVYMLPYPEQLGLRNHI